MLAQPQNMATVNVSLEPKQNCPKKHKCVFSPLALNLKNTDASFCFTVDSRQNTNAFLVFSGKRNERHIRVFSSGYPMIQKNTQKYTRIHKKKHEKNTSPTSVFQTLWRKYKGNRVHSCMGALVTSAAGRLAAASAMSKKKIKALRPTQNPDTEPIHAKNNRFHSKILIFDNYPKSKTKKLTLLTCSYFFHNFNPNSYNSRFKSITKL